MDTNRLVVAVAAIVAALVLLVIVVPPLFTKSDRAVAPAPTSPSTAAPSGPPNRAGAPVVDGQVLDTVSDTAEPPEPTQWAGGTAPIPSNTWWSSAVTGPGAVSLWPQPLGLRISAGGEVQVSNPAGTTRPDGLVEAPFVPALFLDIGPAKTRVIGHGPLHVTIRLEGRNGRHLDLTLVQGSPAVELRANGPVQVRIPGLDLSAVVPAAGTRSVAFGTSEGPWALGADQPTTVTARADRVTLTPSGTGLLALGPVPKGAAAGYEDRLAALASHPLQTTAEDLQVAPDGTTTQVLEQTRFGAATSSGKATLWALQPQHQRYAVRIGHSLGTLPSTLGPLPVVAGPTLRLVYPAVPVLWSAVALPGGATVAAGPPPTEEGTGSYYAGKAAYAWAARGDTLRAAGDRVGAEEATAEAERRLDALWEHDGAPSLRWDARWGSAVIEPAEFASGTELNDHQLQYGYWVAAAAHVAEADPAAADRYRQLIDLLVADYAGAATMPDAPASLPDERTWSPYEGHSWASGTAPFAAGNNLESISESSLSWWAAARWLTVTGRPDLARTFIGRFTIESAVAGYAWLPQGDALPSETSVRPWSGVVWSSKIDVNTWFDPHDESALGIRLLPLGPAALARYPSTDAVDAAKARWTWCDTHGRGCTVRWSNLLDSDAAVAGRAKLSGPDPEPSTTPLVATWWRDLWARSTQVEGWSCSVGVVPRRLKDGSITVLASNPGPHAATLSCRDTAGNLRWSDGVHGTTAIDLGPGS